jgi:hypothetical protein
VAGVYTDATLQTFRDAYNRAFSRHAIGNTIAVNHGMLYDEAILSTLDKLRRGKIGPHNYIGVTKRVQTYGHGPSTIAFARCPRMFDIPTGYTLVPHMTMVVSKRKCKPITKHYPGLFHPVERIDDYVKRGYNVHTVTCNYRAVPNDTMPEIVATELVAMGKRLPH